MAATTPPTINHTALSVGDPVKKRDTSELNDSIALTPQMRSNVPTANNATDMALLFIVRVYVKLFSGMRTLSKPQA